jgi:hypothetical protein
MRLLIVGCVRPNNAAALDIEPVLEIAKNMDKSSQFTILDIFSIPVIQCLPSPRLTERYTDVLQHMEQNFLKKPPRF